MSLLFPIAIQFEIYNYKSEIKKLKRENDFILKNQRKRLKTDYSGSIIFKTKLIKSFTWSGYPLEIKKKQVSEHIYDEVPDEQICCPIFRLFISRLT